MGASQSLEPMQLPRCRKRCPGRSTRREPVPWSRTRRLDRSITSGSLLRQLQRTAGGHRHDGLVHPFGIRPSLFARCFCCLALELDLAEFLAQIGLVGRRVAERLVGNFQHGGYLIGLESCEPFKTAITLVVLGPLYFSNFTCTG